MFVVEGGIFSLSLFIHSRWLALKNTASIRLVLSGEKIRAAMGSLCLKSSGGRPKLTVRWSYAMWEVDLTCAVGLVSSTFHVIARSSVALVIPLSQVGALGATRVPRDSWQNLVSWESAVAICRYLLL